MASRAQMYISITDRPPRLLTINATDDPDGSFSEQEESSSVKRDSICSMMSEAEAIYDAIKLIANIRNIQ